MNSEENKIMNDNGVPDKDLGKICLDAIRRDAFADGMQCGLESGMRIGADKLMDSFNRACDVVKVVHYDYATIVYFSDGESETVTYDPSFGYDYDGEKAVMAAMLKHLTGSRYLKALKRFEGRGEAIIAGDVPVPYSLEGKLNLSRNMVERLSTPAPASDIADHPFIVDYTPDGIPVNLSDDERLLREIAAMNDDSFQIAGEDGIDGHDCCVPCDYGEYPSDNSDDAFSILSDNEAMDDGHFQVSSTDGADRHMPRDDAFSILGDGED